MILSDVAFVASARYTKSLPPWLAINVWICWSVASAVELSKVSDHAAEIGISTDRSPIS
jgi:hypothetical protein